MLGKQDIFQIAHLRLCDYAAMDHLSAKIGTLQIVGRNAPR